ncbi:MAG TPA: S-methyl-5-thioribose-1-phosphate isomerase [Gammaproteobacteria bacterium]|nr:S-methyl-5-thioribose-1-phosphate isomerase [Gammaproteobacteria bacterium]
MTSSPDIRHDTVRAVEWRGDRLRLLDQRRLPDEVVYVDLATADAVADAIADMVVRGAPAIGITAAWGVVLAAREADRDAVTSRAGTVEAAIGRLAAARPTAVNLHWALARMHPGGAVADTRTLEAEAERLQAEDVAANRRMGELGARLIQSGSAVLTHCNTGSLATGGFGTALGVVRAAWSDGRIRRVWVDETRPWLQGARLTAWELRRDDIPASLIVDSAAAHFMSRGEVDWVIVGADRIAANGDVANKIGTYALAVAARYHALRFMVVAPSSTVDPDTAAGADIPIEQRPGEELAAGFRDFRPHAVNPVFDVTPASLVDVLVTERGVLRRPDPEGIARLLAGEAPDTVGPCARL